MHKNSDTGDPFYGSFKKRSAFFHFNSHPSRNIEVLRSGIISVSWEKGKAGSLLKKTHKKCPTEEISAYTKTVETRIRTSIS